MNLTVEETRRRELSWGYERTFIVALGGQELFRVDELNDMHNHQFVPSVRHPNVQPFHTLPGAVSHGLSKLRSAHWYWPMREYLRKQEAS